MRVRSSEKKAAYDKEYYQKNREKIIARSAAHHKKHQAQTNRRSNEFYHKTAKWKRVPGWNKERYLEFLEIQKGKCAICENLMSRPCRDHNHTTNEGRGLLCDPCNRMIGAGFENANTLIKAALYIIRWNADPLGDTE